MNRIALALGSNLGDRLGNLRKAIRLLKTSGIRITATSDIFETSPYGKPDQPRFLNACAIIETDQDGEELLVLLKDIEKQVGRIEREKWGPREIDIDIIFIDQKVVESETLHVPHPEMHKREFVLKPLAQVAPDWIHPVLERTVQEIASEITENDISIVRITRL